MLIAEIFGEWQLPFLMEADRLSSPSAFIAAVLFSSYFALLMFCYGICIVFLFFILIIQMFS